MNTIFSMECVFIKFNKPYIALAVGNIVCFFVV